MAEEEQRDEDPEWLQNFEKPVDDGALELSSSSSGSENENEDVHGFAGRNRQTRRTDQLDDEEDSAAVKRARVVGENEGLPEESPLEIAEQDNLAPEQEDPDGLATAQSCQLADEGTRKSEEKKSKPKMMSSLPLVFADKVSRSKILVEGEGDALDLSGDIGAVGRISVSGKANPEVYFDLKGTIYSTNIVASNSFFLVNIGPTEAKVEAIMNDFVQLRPDTNSDNVETMVEGTMDGITFDSDDEIAAAPEPKQEPTDAPATAKTMKAKTTKAKAGARTKPPRPTKITSKKPAKRGGKASTSRRGASKKAK